MRVDYRCAPKILARFSKRLVVVGGLLIFPTYLQVDKMAASPSPKPDPRTIRLEIFLARLHCPIASMAPDFVHAADQNRLDWRLLPSISVIESGGGKAYRNNNIFGWNNGLEVFPSLRAGLDLVASRLSHSPIYRNRDLIGKLHLYNPDETYAGKVLGVMNRISPSVNLQVATNRLPASASPNEAGE